MIQYKMLLSDIDGTLRPFASPVIPTENTEAIKELQHHGILFALSTGRSRFAVSEKLLNGIKPDYWICAAGAQVLNGDGTEISVTDMPLQAVEMLTRYCSEWNYPLRFVFSDGFYVYSGLEEYQQWVRSLGVNVPLIDGRDRKRHMIDLPLAANAILTDEAVAEFYRRNPDSGLRFPRIKSDHRDVLWKGLSKASGLRKLLDVCGLSMEECVSVGDGDNDVEILSQTGLSYCMANGSPDAKKAAKKICPAAEDFGVAAICRELISGSVQ